jgi:hypothetical protein
VEEVLKEEKSKKKSNALIDLLFNIVLPSVILMKFSSPERLGQMNAFIIALAFPICYGIYDFIKRKNFNAFVILGFVNVLLTGGLGLLKVEGIWFAVKEATVPSIIGLAILISMKFKPLVRTMLYNDTIMDTQKVNAALDAHSAHQAFDKLLINTSYLLASSFFLSAVLNFTLAVVILKSPAGTVEFNQELGKMQALSFPVIMIPCMIVMGFTLWKLINGIKHLTGLELEEVLKQK